MLTGAKTVLRKATEADRRGVYEWLAHSDITPSIMGPPRFPEHPIPTWEQFCADYCPHYFDDSQPGAGRCFIIASGGNDVGVVCYNALRANGMTDVDIWLRSEADCSQGFGTDALMTLTDYLHREFDVTHIAVSPSARNHPAIAAYKDAGFRWVSAAMRHRFIKRDDMEYEDSVVLVKNYAFPLSAQLPGTCATARSSAIIA